MPSNRYAIHGRFGKMKSLVITLFVKSRLNIFLKFYWNTKWDNQRNLQIGLSLTKISYFYLKWSFIFVQLVLDDPVELSNSWNTYVPLISRSSLSSSSLVKGSGLGLDSCCDARRWCWGWITWWGPAAAPMPNKRPLPVLLDLWWIFLDLCPDIATPLLLSLLWTATMTTLCFNIQIIRHQSV